MNRKAAVAIWMLPPVVVLAMAVAWWLSPAQSRPSPIPDAETPAPTDSIMPVSAEIVNEAPGTSDSNQSSVVHASSRGTESPALLTQNPAGSTESGHSERHRGEIRSQSGKGAALPPEAVSDTALFEGEWTGYYQGKREMNVKTDGTGRMVAFPDGIAATLLAPKLTFDFRWAVKHGHLELETVGGEPAAKVNIVTQMFGRRRVHKILKQSPELLILLDEDGVTEYTWSRVPRKLKQKTSSDSSAGESQ